MDWTISAQETDWFAGGNFQLTVTDARKSFFVVLATAHLEWLVGTMQVAATQRWRFHIHCEREWLGRIVAIGCMWREGRRWLCISETCSKDRSFFVKIPVEPHSDGWPSLLKFLGSLLEGYDAPVQGARVKSYAEMAGPMSFPVAGDCEVLVSRGVHSVRVNPDGVADRKAYLDNGWCSWAGLSRLEAGEGLNWLRIEGIPLHLRSPSLFRQLGNCCGKFIDFKTEGCDWNTVKVKVKAAGILPREILLTFDGCHFYVQVAIEDGRGFMDGWKGSGPDVYVRTSTARRSRTSPKVGFLVGSEQGGSGRLDPENVEVPTVQEGLRGSGIEICEEETDHDRILQQMEDCSGSGCKEDEMGTDE
ncbi:hypothetical protein LINGRAHAP2_LOCUS28889 [Linum grandiflorum]